MIEGEKVTVEGVVESVNPEWIGVRIAGLRGIVHVPAPRAIVAPVVAFDHRAVEPVPNRAKAKA